MQAAERPKFTNVLANGNYCGLGSIHTSRKTRSVNNLCTQISEF